jgi:hypothetical protein
MTEKKPKGADKPEFTVGLEYEPGEDAEERLVRIYEALLGAGELSGIYFEEGELT